MTILERGSLHPGSWSTSLSGTYRPNWSITLFVTSGLLWREMMDRYSLFSNCCAYLSWTFFKNIYIHIHKLSILKYDKFSFSLFTTFIIYKTKWKFNNLFDEMINSRKGYSQWSTCFLTHITVVTFLLTPPPSPDMKKTTKVVCEHVWRNCSIPFLNP